MKPPRDIRELWDQAIATQTSEELDRVIPELRQALHQHCEGIREKLAEYPRLAHQINDLLLDQDVQAPGTNQPPRPGHNNKPQ
jgi:hypothetical protein